MDAIDQEVLFHTPERPNSPLSHARAYYRLEEDRIRKESTEPRPLPGNLPVTMDKTLHRRPDLVKRLSTAATWHQDVSMEQGFMPKESTNAETPQHPAKDANETEISSSPLTPLADDAQQDLEVPGINLDNATDPTVNPLPNPPTGERSFEEPLKPHPCCLPHPESMSARGISCITRVFLVDFLPPTYPFLPFRTSYSTTLRLQIPFFIYSGPDPPPAELGSPGDLYVAPATNALYACMAVAGTDGGGGAGSGVWTPWCAIGYSEPKLRAFKLSEPGLLLHPYFPAHVLWTFKASFGWYSLLTLNNLRCDSQLKILMKGHEEAGEAAKVLVAQTLQLQQEKAILAADRKGEKGKKKGAKRRASAVENEEEEEGEREDDEDDYEPKKKKAREEANAVVPNKLSIAQQARRARERLERANRALPPSASHSVSVGTTSAYQQQSSVPTSAPAPASAATAPHASGNDWDAYYGRPRGNTRTGKDLRELAAVIARLEAENAVLKGEVAEHWTLKMAVEKLKRENEALKAKLEGEGRGSTVSMSSVAPVQRGEAEGGGMRQERIPFHPEFLDFMRETFASEMMKSCNSQRVAAETSAADAKLQVAALQSKLTQSDDAMELEDDTSATSDQLRIAHARAEDRRDALRPGQLGITVATTIRELEDRIKEQEAEIDRVTAALDVATICISDQQKEILTSKGEVARLTRSADEETDLLKRLLAARESAKEKEGQGQ